MNESEVAIKWNWGHGFVLLGAAIAVAIAAGATGSPAYGQSDEVTLTLGVEGNGQVAINPSGFPSVIACVSRCTKVVPPNTPVTIVADAPEGFIPVWGAACDGVTGDSCTLTPDADASVTVAFVAAPPPSPPPVIDPGEGPPPAHEPPPSIAPGPPSQHEPPPSIAPGPPSQQEPPQSIDPGPPSPQPTAGQKAVADALKKLPIGRVVFNVPPTLKLGDVAEIHVALSLQETHKQLKERITEIGVIEGGELSVSDDMRATLTGADFEILPLLDERQAVSAEDTTEWLWQVKPLDTGVRLLKLTLYAFVRVGDKESSRSVKSFTKDLKIHVTWAERVSGFAGGNWQWLWTAILVPLAAFVMARRRGGATPHHR